MRKTLDLNALRTLAEVAASGSFSAAAKRLQRNVSSVSRQIAALEESLGQRLFYRHTRAVRLTDDGQRYVNAVRPLLDGLDQATESTFRADGAPSGVLHINGPVAFCQRQLMPLIADFQRRYPAVRAELTLTDTFVDPVQAGADITFRVGELADSSLIARPLAPMNYVLAAAPSYLDSRGVPRTPAALIDHDCLRYKGDHGRQFWFARAQPDAAFERLEIDGPLYSDDALSLLEAALLGQGLVLFPSWLMDRELRAGTLVPVLDDFEWAISPETRRIHLVYAEARLASPKVRAFIDHVLKGVGEPPVWDCWAQPVTSSDDAPP